MYRPFATSPEQDAVLDAALARAVAAGPRGVCVLDVDGCLMDTRHRQVHIFRAFAEATDRWVLAGITVDAFVDRDLRRTMENAGATAAEAAAWYPELRTFWGERFFDDHHVELDAAMPGAARFVRALHAAGGRVAYLTGRHATMRPATARCFRRYGLPIDDRASFFDKPDPRTEDHVHKVAQFDAIAALGEVVVCMDNEPINTNLLHDRFPTATSVFVDSDCSDRGVVVYGHVPRIHGFLRTTDRR